MYIYNAFGDPATGGPADGLPVPLGGVRSSRGLGCLFRIGPCRPFLGVASWGCLVMRLPRSFTDATDITMHLRESIFRWHKLGEADAGGDGPVHLASSVSSLASTPRGSRQEVPDHHPHTSLECRSDWSVFT